MKAKNKMGRIFVILFVLLSSIVRAGSPEAGDKEGLEKVSVQFLWLHQFQFAGYYMAKEKGFYANAGLDVELKEYVQGMDVTDEVIHGRSDFGIGRSSLIIEKTQHKPIVILSAIFQKSPHILLAKKSSGFTKISDLKNKKVMITGDLANSASIVAMLANQGLGLDDIQRQEHTFDLNDLVDGKTDIMGAYVSNEPYRLNKMGIQSQIFDPADYGFDLYSDMLFTSQDELSRHPERVQAFKEATLKGWEYAFSNIEETAKLIHAQYNTQNRSVDALIYEGRVLKEYAYVDDIDLGNVDMHKVQRIADIYFVLGLIQKGFVLDDLLLRDGRGGVKPLFTLDELKWIESHPVIRVGAHTDYTPFEYVEHMKHKGMVPEYLELLEKRTGLKFHVEKTNKWPKVIDKIREKELDMLGLSVQSEERGDYLNFTRPYFSFPIAIITKDNISYLQDYKQLQNKKVVVVQGSPADVLLAMKYSQIKYTAVPNMDIALKMVSYGEAFAFLGNIATSSYYIKENGLTNLKVSGDMGDHLELSMAGRKDWPELTSILQKAIDSISEKEKNDIYNKWMFLEYEQRVDFNLVMKIIVGLVLLLFVPIIWVVLLRNQITKRKLVEKKLHEEVEKTKKLSITDALTGINNRLHLDQFLEQEITRSQRYGNNLSIILIDIDDFKEVNDRYGHIVGDSVLREFVHIISPTIRKTDMFGRWGGEEFLIICTETDVIRASEMAEVIRAKIESFTFTSVGHKTASIGVTEYIPDDTIVSFISRADSALYTAKEEGKNRVVPHIHRGNRD